MKILLFIFNILRCVAQLFNYSFYFGRNTGRFLCCVPVLLNRLIGCVRSSAYSTKGCSDDLARQVCSSSNALEQFARFWSGRVRLNIFKSCHLALIVQSAVPEGLLLDPSAFCQDGFAAPESCHAVGRWQGRLDPLHRFGNGLARRREAHISRRKRPEVDRRDTHVEVANSDASSFKSGGKDNGKPWLLLDAALSSPRCGFAKSGHDCFWTAG